MPGFDCYNLHAYCGCFDSELILDKKWNTPRIGPLRQSSGFTGVLPETQAGGLVNEVRLLRLIEHGVSWSAVQHVGKQDPAWHCGIDGSFPGAKLKGSAVFSSAISRSGWQPRVHKYSWSSTAGDEKKTFAYAMSRNGIHWFRRGRPRLNCPEARSQMVKIFAKAIKVD